MAYKRYVRGTRGAGWGDKVADFTEATGLDKVAQLVANALGYEDCGCDERREQLNELEKKIKGK